MNQLRIKKIFITLVLVACAAVGFAQINHATPKAGHLVTEEFIQQNLLYPESDLDVGNKGKVVVTFHLDDKGNGSNYQIKESFSEAANGNALDLVKKILWNPATKNMLPIESDMEYAVEYNAKAYKRYWKKRERVAVPLAMEVDSSYQIYELRQLEEAAKPYFADGSTMPNYILSNLKYPEAAKVGEIHGTVRLSFVVETDGNVSNITVLNSVGGGCDNEAIRLLQNTHWVPAVKNGKYVRSFNKQDITFNFGERNYQDGNAY
jgi:TonB family protein